jgi:hypothetical protein
MDLETLQQQLDLEFREFKFGAANFPLLFGKGLDNSAVHAAGVSYLLALGIEYGLSSIAEYPITVHADNHWKAFGKIMPDAVWFHPHSNQPWIAFEFERFEKGDELKIKEKAKNLALSYYQSKQSIEVCVLIYWLRSGFAPNTIDPIINIFSKVFVANQITIPPPQCRFLAYKFVLCQVTQLQPPANEGWIGEVRGCYQTSSDSNGNLVVSSASRVVGETG